MKLMMHLCLILAAIVAASSAAAEEVKALNIHEKTYIKAVVSRADGVKELVPGTYWTGEKVVARDGKCIHVTQELLELKTIRSSLGEIQASDIKAKSVEVDCATRRSGNLTW